jgi:membrane AbrB-like protein
MDFTVLSGSIGPVALAAALGWLGWKIAGRLNFPAPAMIGSMILVGISVLLGAPAASVPVWFRVLIQSVVGGNLGRRIDRGTLGSIGRMLPAIVFTSAWYVVFTTGLGYLVARWAGIDLRTAFLATAPGGVAEMTAMAITTGADVAFVATLQALRVMTTNIAIPFLAKQGTEPAAVHAGSGTEAKKDSPELHWIFGLAASVAGGTILTWANFPAGGVIGSMLVIAVLRLGGCATHPVPRVLLDAAYVGLGISVGVSFDSKALLQLQSSLGILAFATLGTLASGFLLALFVRRIMGLDYRTAMLACSPGGLSTMATVAEETGGQSLVVGLFQLVRIIWVILAMPLFLHFL